MRILALLAVVSLLRGAEGEEYFERKVRPVLATRCQGFHAS